MELNEERLDVYLKSYTAKLHLRTEENLEPLQLFENLTLANYATFIRIQYGWHDALEEILLTLSPDLVFDNYQYTLKAPLLRKDLEALNADIVKLILPEFKNPEAPGILYVLEGSMLGGTVISKQLEISGIDPKYRNYFSYCATNAKKVWPLTRKYLQRIENRNGKFEECLKSSNFCFEQMIDFSNQQIAESNW